MKRIHRFRMHGACVSFRPPNNYMHFVYAGKWRLSDYDCYWIWDRKTPIGWVHGHAGVWYLDDMLYDAPVFPTLRKAGLWLRSYPRKRMEELIKQGR